MEDVLNRLANGELLVFYHGAEQGQTIDKILADSEHSVSFDIIGDITRDIAERWPYYFVYKGTPNVESTTQGACKILGKDVACMDFEDFIEALYGDCGDEGEIAADISDII